MPDYSKGKIYKICNTIDDKLYVGSTCMDLDRRFYYHKAQMNKHPNSLLYQHMNTLGIYNFNIELVEEIACTNSMELLQREGSYVRCMGSLNKNIPGRTKVEYRKEYYQKHRDKYIEKQRLYDRMHMDRIKERMREYYRSKKAE